MIILFEVSMLMKAFGSYRVVKHCASLHWIKAKNISQALDAKVNCKNGPNKLKCTVNFMCKYKCRLFRAFSTD